MASNAETSHDMARIIVALAEARAHIAALDNAEVIRTGDEHRRRSRLRTILEHAEEAAGRVVEALGIQLDSPPIGRDGGPL